MFVSARAKSDYVIGSLGRRRLQDDAWRVELLHGAPEHRLFWITRGQGRVCVEGITRGYGPNTAIFVPAETQMALELPAQTQGTELHLPKSVDFGLPKAPFHLRVSGIEAQASLTGHLEKVERELAANAPAMDRALQGYGLLISAWMTRELSRPDAMPVPDKAHLLAAQFTRLVERQFRSGNGVADYARLLQVTPTHLSRVCKANSGRPAHALLTERIMYEARRLLLDTDMSAREISETLGFSSAAYFTRAFQQANGQTPSAYRSNSVRA